MTKQAKTVKSDKSDKSVKEATEVKVVSLMTDKDILTNASELKRKTELWALRTKKAIQKEAQILAVSAIFHAGKHGNIHPARDLIASMPEGMNVNSMKRFFEKYANIRVLSADDVQDGAKHAGMKEGEIIIDQSRKVNLGEAMTTGWWSVLPMAVYRPMDLVGEVVKLVERVERAQRKGVSTEKGDNIPQEALQALKAIVKAHKASTAA